MYRNAYQRGLLTILFSGGTNPLTIWDTKVQSGYITRFLDQDLKAMVLEIGGTNVSTSYMVCPKGKTVLGVSMPFLIMVVKNLKKYFSFEVTILDETGTRRRFRASNFQSNTQIMPLCTAMPIGLSEGWNQIQFNLAEFTRRAYSKQFVEVLKVKVNANIRIRRIYFAERLLPEDQLPAEYKLFFPLTTKGRKGKKAVAQETKAPTPVIAVEENKGSQVLIKAGSKASMRSIKAISEVPSTKAISEVKVEPTSVPSIENIVEVKEELKEELLETPVEVDPEETVTEFAPDSEGVESTSPDVVQAEDINATEEIAAENVPESELPSEEPPPE